MVAKTDINENIIMNFVTVTKSQLFSLRVRKQTTADMSLNEN